MTKHIAIWIDHREAHIFYIRPDKIDEATVTAKLPNSHHNHPRGPNSFKAHPEDAKKFFQEVARALEGTEEVLVVGPSTAKLDFLRYAHSHNKTLESRIVGIATVDHPTDRQVVAYAKEYFHIADRSLGATNW